MRIRILHILLFLQLSINCQGQYIDSSYVGQYNRKMMITGFLANDQIELRKNKVLYNPNNRMNIGVGLLVDHTAINVRAGMGVIPIRDGKYGKTQSLDIQFHRYGRKLLLDVFFQRYKGYYTQPAKDSVSLFPDIAVRQIGVEVAYLFNGRKFSAKAAFEQSELQVRSAGTFILGGGIYYNSIHAGTELLPVNETRINSEQIGMNAGYAYSWVMSRHWLLASMATIGLNVGHQPGMIKLYPGVLGRTAINYRYADWGLSFLFLIHNKLLYVPDAGKISQTSVNMQLAYVKNIHNLFH